MTLSILTFVETLFSQIFQGILGIIQGGLSSILAAVGINVNEVLNAFVQQLNSFGAWMPIIMIALFGATGAAIYLELSMFRTVDDID